MTYTAHAQRIAIVNEVVRGTGAAMAERCAPDGLGIGAVDPIEADRTGTAEVIAGGSS